MSVEWARQLLRRESKWTILSPDHVQDLDRSPGQDLSHLISLGHTRQSYVFLSIRNDELEVATLLRHGDLLPCAFLGDYGKDSFILPQSPLLLPHYYMGSGRLQLAETRSTKRVRRMPQNSVATDRYYNIFLFVAS